MGLGRKIVIAAFMVCFGIALYVFLNRDSRSLSENIDADVEREPRIVLEDFVVYRYQDEKVISKVTARLGHFFEPNQLEMDGEIRAMRLTDDGPERLGSESATAYFTADSLSSMMKDTELERAEVTGFVEVGVRDHILTTDYAEYIARTDVVSSNRPVRVEGPGRVFSGDEGFTWDIKTMALKLEGPIRGEVNPDEKDRK